MKSTPSRTSLQNKDKHFAALSIKVETLNDELVEHEEMNKPEKPKPHMTIPQIEQWINKSL